MIELFLLLLIFLINSDLNKELSKMKELLTDIVDKMSHNLVEDTPSTGSLLSQEQVETNSSTKVNIHIHLNHCNPKYSY